MSYFYTYFTALSHVGQAEKKKKLANNSLFLIRNQDKIKTAAGCAFFRIVLGNQWLKSLGRNSYVYVGRTEKVTLRAIALKGICSPII